VSVPERVSPTAFGVEGVRLSRTGLIVTDPRLPFEAFEHVGRQLGEVRDMTAWALGDWLLAGEALYGEEAYQAVEATGRSKVTLTEYARVARQVPPSRRRASLSWGHHQAVAARPPDQQTRWLDAAETNRWSREELRGALQPELPPSRLGEPSDVTITTSLVVAARAVVHASVRHHGSAIVPIELIERLRGALGE
jgi:hypothetical protein